MTTWLLFSNPLQEAWPGFPIATCDYKNCSETACDESEGKTEQKFDEDFETILKISTNFCLHYSACRNFLIILSWKAKQAKTLTTFAYAQTVLL